MCEIFEITGDRKDENGDAIVEEVELWRRNPVDCVRELIGNPAFKDGMKYTPEKHYEDEELNNRVYDEMATGDWWWEVQASAHIQILIGYDSIKTFAEFGTIHRVNFRLVRQCHQSIFPQIRQTCRGLLVTNKGGLYTSPLEISARIHVANSQSVPPSSSDTFRSRSLNALMRRTVRSRDIACFTSA